MMGLLLIVSCFRKSPEEQARAKAEEGPTACAVLIAKSIREPEQVEYLFGVAECMAAHRREEKAQVLNHATELARASRHPEYQLQRLARAWHEAGRNDKALEVLREVPDAYTYAAIGEPDRALEVASRIGVPPADGEFQRSNDTHDKANALTCIAGAYLDAGEKSRALELLAQASGLVKAIGDDHWEARTTEHIALGYARAGELERALYLARHMKESLFPEPSESRLAPVHFKLMAMIRIANMLLDGGHKDEASQVLSEARDVARKIDHPYLKAEMLKDVALTFAGAGRYDWGCMWKHHGICEGPDPDMGLQIARSIEHPLLKAITLDWISGTCLKLGQQSRALAILGEAHRTVTGIPDGSPCADIGELGFLSRSKEDVLARLAGTYAEAGQFSQAFQIAEATTTTYSVEALTYIGLAYAKCGEKRKALDLLSRVVDQYGAYDDRVQAYVEVGAWQEALKWATAKGNDDARETLVMKCVEAGRYDDAIEVASAMKEAYSKAEALARVGAHYPTAGQGMSHKARGILRGMVARSLHPHPGSPQETQ